MIAPASPPGSRRASQRLRCKTRRILLLVDVMAPYRYFLRTDHLRHLLCERLGEVICSRTVLRDLQLLESIGMVDRLGRCSRSPAQWRLNLRQSESLQTAAIKLEEREQVVA